MDEIRKKLILRVKEMEEKESRAREYKEKAEAVVKTVKEAIQSNVEVSRSRSGLKCFYCDKFGHVARACYLRKAKENYSDKNKGNLNYLSVDCESSSDSDTREKKGYKRTSKGKYKLNTPEKTYESKEDGKRKKLNLDRYVEEFKEVFSIGKEKIKYCGLEKCKIVTEKGKKVFKKGQMVPQALIRDTEKHLEDLQRREVIRESTVAAKKKAYALFCVFKGYIQYRKMNFISFLNILWKFIFYF